MTGVLWLRIALGGMVVSAIGLRAIATARQTELVRTHTSLLDSGSLDAQGRLPSPARFDAHELEGLPAPVQRHLWARMESW